MGPAIFPEAGSQIKRRTDGVLGEVEGAQPAVNLVSVRWPSIPGAWRREECTLAEFFRHWELTGVKLSPPRPARLALVFIAGAVLAFFVAVVVHGDHIDAHSMPDQTDSAQAASNDNPVPLNNAQELYGKYGLTAAQRCAASADEYVRSVTHHRFYWEEGDDGLLPRFDGFSSTLIDTGVLTLNSNKVRVSNGFGVFSPVRIYCNYDTQTGEVISYATQ
jgi:hypothetical protein